MSDAEFYRERAARAESLAAEVADPDHRAQLMAIASDWRLLAEQAAVIEAGRVRSPGTVIPFPPNFLAGETDES
jgi:hypothetical protein